MMLIRTSLAVLLATVLCLNTPDKAAAHDDPSFLSLVQDAENDPQKALTRIAELLRVLEQNAVPDRRAIYDLYRLNADLLIRLGDTRGAAAQVADLAEYAQRYRRELDINPAALMAEAARLAEAAGDLRAAERALRALIEEHRQGAAPNAVIAATLDEQARLRDLKGDTTEATRLRAQAETLRDAAPIETSTRGDDKGFREIDVYYATDRARTGDTDPATYYGNERGEMELGIATVTIPETHTPGVLEAPSIWKLEFRANPAKHVVLQSIEPLNPDIFYGRLQNEFREVPQREAFVFIHGYNVIFDQAARRAAQIAYDMSYEGVPILYSWPSWGSTVGYVSDTAVVRLSGRRLSRFLEDLATRSGAETIHLVAHSMGNRALTDALELMALRLGQTDQSAPVFGQILFAAPDVDAGLFKEMLPTIRPLAQRLTLYASEQDWALATSRKMHGNAPRAGLGGENILSSAAIDSIDMSELGDDMLAHSYFADDSSALADMMTLFWLNTDPKGRCGLIPEDPASDTAHVWRYRPGVCANAALIEILAHLRHENAQSMDDVRAVLQREVEDVEMIKELELVLSGIVKNP